MNYWLGSKVKLRPLEAKDLKLFEMLDDEFDKNIDAIRFPRMKDNLKSWIEKEMQSRFGDAFRWIAEDQDGNAVGTIETFACDRRNGTFKYGIAIARPYWGQGYAKEMIRMVIQYYFFELGYQKVTPHVFSFNERSIQLHQNLGFTLEGRLRKMIYTDGKHYDEIHFGLTKDEFNQLETKDQSSK
jgi:RimJ/RimL family protein N-acetyltransferase